METTCGCDSFIASARYPCRGTLSIKSGTCSFRCEASQRGWIQMAILETEMLHLFEVALTHIVSMMTVIAIRIKRIGHGTWY